MGLLLLYVGIALSVSFLCSLLEATLLAARIASLSELRDRGNKGAGKLLELKKSRLDDAISAILTLNTVANTLGATLAGAQAARAFGDAWVGLFSGVLTFLILIFSEIIPKTLGAVYSRALAGTVGWILAALTLVMTPAIVVTRSFTRLLTRGRTIAFSRGELAAVIATATTEGTLAHDESKMLANLLRLRDVQVEDVMTPQTVTFMMSADATVADLLAEPEAADFSRIPLFRGDPENVVGYVLQRDVLQAVADECNRQDRLERFLRDICFIPELASIDAALRQILQRREPIAMVTDEHGSIAGLVTLEDLTESILGVEIVDESDRITDMRELAASLRDRRLERMRAKRRGRLSRPEKDPVR